MAKKQDKYTKSSRGKPCLIRIPGYCKPAPENETTVLCHLNGGGMASKNLNIHAADGCNVCHDIVDGRMQNTGFTPEEIELMFLQGVIRTQIRMVNDGTLKL